jgi:hypothetical protein
MFDSNPLERKNKGSPGDKDSLRAGRGFVLHSVNLGMHGGHGGQCPRSTDGREGRLRFQDETCMPASYPESAFIIYKQKIVCIKFSSYLLQKDRISVVLHQSFGLWTCLSRAYQFRESEQHPNMN